jgi:hypothetical protein
MKPEAWFSAQLASPVNLIAFADGKGRQLLLDRPHLTPEKT